MARRDAIFPAKPHALYAQHRYSPAIRSGDLLFVSGQVGARPDGTPEPELEAQVRLAMDNLIAVLAGAGATFDDVVDVTIFLIDPEAILDRVFAVIADYWGREPYPNVTVPGVTWLAGFQFEIKVIARIPDTSRDG